MLNYRRIKYVCKEKGISMEELAVKVDMSLSGLYAAFANNSLKVETFFKICTFLNIPFIDLLTDEQVGAEDLAPNNREELIKVIVETRKKLRQARAMFMNVITVTGRDRKIAKNLDTEYQNILRTHYEKQLEYWSVNQHLYTSNDDWIKSKPVVSEKTTLKKSIQDQINQLFALENRIDELVDN